MRTGIFITVRTGSTRLPQKALKPVLNQPVIGYLISRIAHCNRKQADIYIVTTDLEEDKLLDNIAKEYGIDCFHGDESNIIKRHLQCANQFGIDFIINVDGDDIFCHPEYILKISEFALLHKEYDVIKTEGLPFGTNSMGYRKNVLEKILAEHDFSKSDTGWGQLILDSTKFKIYNIYPQESEKLSVRLTLDYQEDFQLFKKTIEDLEMDQNIVDQKEIISYLRDREEVVKINEHLNEVYWRNFHAKKMRVEENV